MRISILLLVFFIILSGCSVKYKAVGSFDDFDETFLGDLDHNLLSGTAQIQAATKSGIKCEGNSYVTYIPPLSLGCAGQRGKAPMKCSDGRRLDIDWIAKSCTTGSGVGKDQNGNTFSLAFGIDEETAQAELARLTAESREKPQLPAYRPKEVRKEKGFSTGTGFFITYDGVMVTNHHVIDGAKEVVVISPSEGKEFSARILQTDPANDIAVIKIEARTVPIPIARSFTSVKGEEVITLGYPLVAIQGQEQKATFGRINALTGIKGDIRFTQIDVPIQPGNSGGPLINKKGDVVGVVTATLDQFITLKASGALPQNVNYAVKSDYIHPVVTMALQGQSLPFADNKTPDMDTAKVVSLRESSVMLVVAR